MLYILLVTASVFDMKMALNLKVNLLRFHVDVTTLNLQSEFDL